MMKRIVITSILATMLFTALSAHVVLETRLTGEHFKPGDIIKIEWSVLVEHDQIDWALFFSVDGGNTWEPIEEGLPLYQLTYDWTAPQMESDKMLVQIIQNNDVTEDYFDISDTFSIAAESTTPIFNFDQLTIETQFYPNPVQNEATLIIHHAGNHQLKVSIYNMHGQMVDRLFSERIQNNNHYYPWKTNRFPPGIYQVNVEFEGKSRSFPILVSR